MSDSQVIVRDHGAFDHEPTPIEINFERFNDYVRAPTQNSTDDWLDC